jgi:hypothetical protein
MILPRQWQTGARIDPDLRTGVVAALVMVSAQAEHIGRIPSIAAFADVEDMVHLRGGLDALLEPTVLAQRLTLELGGAGFAPLPA